MNASTSARRDTLFIADLGRPRLPVELHLHEQLSQAPRARTADSRRRRRVARGCRRLGDRMRLAGRRGPSGMVGAADDGRRGAGREWSLRDVQCHRADCPSPCLRSAVGDSCQATPGSRQRLRHAHCQTRPRTRSTSKSWNSRESWNSRGHVPVNRSSFEVANAMHDPEQVKPGIDLGCVQCQKNSVSIIRRVPASVGIAVWR